MKKNILMLLALCVLLSSDSLFAASNALPTSGTFMAKDKDKDHDKDKDKHHKHKKHKDKDHDHDKDKHDHDKDKH